MAQTQETNWYTIKVQNNYERKVKERIEMELIRGKYDCKIVIPMDRTFSVKKGKKVKAIVKLAIAAGKANPAPPVGPALGQHGVAIMEFCKEFNARTAQMGDNVIPAILTVYEDRSFTFITKTPVTSHLIKKSLGVAKGSAVPNKDKIGKLSRNQAEEIAKIKMPDLNTKDLDTAVKIVAGIARSMGVEVEK